jgi:hypothetical protein
MLVGLSIPNKAKSYPMKQFGLEVDNKVFTWINVYFQYVSYIDIESIRWSEKPLLKQAGATQNKGMWVAIHRLVPLDKGMRVAVTAILIKDKDSVLMML